jgi:glycosyltransferase involved in cell wall biosynthesis
LSFVLVHQKVPDAANLPKRVAAYEVPVGIYHDSGILPDPALSRLALGIPDGKRVYLSFGFIRDNKNIDLFIRAMPHIDDVFLVVAGRNQSTKDKSVAYYTDLAVQCGVSDRVRFESGFIDDNQVSLYFSACDYVLLTYAGTFHSQSGVLNIAAKYHKPLFASSGESPLQDAVNNYQLGIFVAPDCSTAISAGLKINFDATNCNWEGYCNYASWRTNVAPILKELNKNSA